ncbi:MAG TPA: tripartite tricarboxylate transporter substrate binding protein [Xanthobacteraceae bacterium]|nr:tripartite tricarboxylate transporter substrate binding protein [Xanthobacteraceae bacterium]
MRLWGLAVAAAVAVAGPNGAAAQTKYPERAVRLIVGFTAGSATDITGRLFAQKFSEAWGVPVTVENVPGSSGAIGADRVAKAEPDGYTLMWTGNAAITIVPVLQGTPFDPTKDFTPITAALVMPSIVAVNNDVPAKNLQEFIALAKKQPGKLSYATPGVGTPQHIAGEMLKKQAGIDIVHVPYRGAQISDVLAGRVPMTLQNAGAMLPVVREGKLRGIAVTALKRSTKMPDIPTVAEQGFPGFEAISWFGLLAPAGTPQPIVQKIHDEALKVLADAKTRERIDQLGLEPVGNKPEEMAASIKADLAKWDKVIKEAGIQVSK